MIESPESLIICEVCRKAAWQNGCRCYTPVNCLPCDDNHFPRSHTQNYNAQSAALDQRFTSINS